MKELTQDINTVKYLLQSIKRSICPPEEFTTVELERLDIHVAEITSLADDLSRTMYLKQFHSLLKTSLDGLSQKPEYFMQEQTVIKKKEYPDHMTEKQVSEMTGIALPTLRNHRFQRTGLEYIKISKSVRCSYETVKEYLEKRRIKSRF